MNASIQIKLDRVALDRLCRLGYLHPQDRDPSTIRDAATAALMDRLAPTTPAAPCHDARHG